ncbi:hypothetical protein [Pseudoroseomonas cervicalis]|uniref:hypothetical protein n=1 Tax=Teichococcus cervicalis TaxID=204525 RepID=UPI0022F172F1|nr:hypothetical protein [Pseudoroseomonas cervicalis]WBV43665.1 hypothetical protein PFY06_03630 [Pseudoroseomonas cervicalis]
MSDIRKKPATAPQAEAPMAFDEAEVEYLAKRLRVSAAIIREIMRRIGSGERSAVEREFRKGMARR